MDKNFDYAAKAGKPALPVSVPCFRICDGAYGFRTPSERALAVAELRSRVVGYEVGATFYQDTQAFVAAQIILWPRDGRQGGFRINADGAIIDSRSRKIVEASR